MSDEDRDIDIESDVSIYISPGRLDLCIFAHFYGTSLTFWVLFPDCPADVMEGVSRGRISMLMFSALFGAWVF